MLEQFTGGTVPASLFTKECWDDIKAVMSPTGVLAVNFAGNIASPAAHLVIATILSSFPFCRAYEDGPPAGAFRNIIVLCSATSHLTFRAPVRADYLKYPSPAIRKRALETFQDYEIDLRGTDRTRIVQDVNLEILERAQYTGAVEHWLMMKYVLPNSTWAIW